MRIAILSDIHGNLPALDAVLADAEARRVDVVVNLGDILSGPLWPVETADRLIPLGLPTIRGNHERQLLESDHAAMGASDRHAIERLKEHHRAWIAGLPETLTPWPDVRMVHGTPGRDVSYFLHSVDPRGLRDASDAELEERAGGRREALILCGHTHLPACRRLDDDRLIVNPGSVGLPGYTADWPHPHVVETGTPHARYAIAERRDGIWSAELLVVAYDWEVAARQAEANGRPDWAKPLRTGRA